MDALSNDSLLPGLTANIDAVQNGTWKTLMLARGMLNKRLPDDIQPWPEGSDHRLVYAYSLRQTYKSEEWAPYEHVRLRPCRCNQCRP